MPPLLIQQQPRSEMLRELTRSLMARPPMPVYGPAGAIANVAAPMIGAGLEAYGEQRERKERQAETSALGRLLSEAAEAQKTGGDPLEAVNATLAESEGAPGYAGAGRAFMDLYQAQLAQSLFERPETETFGQPQEVMVGGAPALVRFGNRGGQQVVEGAGPIPKTPKRDLKTVEGVGVVDFTDPSRPQIVMASQKTGPGAPKIGDVSSLRKEWRNASKSFIQVRDAFGRIKATADNPSPAADIALIFNFMRMQDPASTVREGEFATAENAGGVPQQIRAQYNKLMTGERLTPEIRKDFVDTSELLFSQAKTQQDMRDEMYRNFARGSGIDPGRVVADITTVAEGARSQPPAAPVTPAPAPAVPAAPAPTGQTLTSGMTGAAAAPQSGRAADHEEGAIATYPDGRQFINRGGQWVPLP